MATVPGMTLAEASSINKLTFLLSAISYSDNDLDAVTKRQMLATVKALKLFVQAEERALAREALVQIEEFFADSRHADAVARKVARVRRMFGWEAAS